MFKEVFDAGGFDIVIGNPPYVDIKALPNSTVKLLKTIYNTVENRMNLYSVFVEQAHSLCKFNGSISYIIPNSILLNSSYTKIRNLIVEGIDSLVKLPDNIFQNASVETITFLYKKNVLRKNIKGAYYRNNERIDFSKLKFKQFERDYWIEDKKNKFNIFVSPEISNILSDIEQNKTSIEKLFDFSLGITPYDKYRGHTQETIKNREFHSKEKITEDYKPLISGKNVLKYHVSYQKIEEYIKYGNWLGAQRQEKFFTEPRLIIRQILSGTPSSIYCGYTEKELYHTQIGFAILAKSNNNFPIKGLCAILNSKLMNFYHKYKFLDIEKITFQKILIENCRALPIPTELPFNTNIIDYILSINEIQLKNENIVEYELLTSSFEEVIDALVFELYFPEDFKKANIEILKYAEKEFVDIERKSEEEQKEIILDTYQRLTEKKNPLRNQIKLMKIELKELLNPILSV